MSHFEKFELIYSRNIFLRNIFFKIVLAYITLYEHKIAHIDLEPKNIVVKKIQEGFKIKIVDFRNSRHITSSLSKGKSERENYIPPWQNEKMNLLTNTIFFR